MTEELVDILLFPIPRLDKSTESGMKELTNIIRKRENHHNFLTKINKHELNSEIISCVEIPDISFSEPPYSKPKDKIRTKKY